MSFCKSLPSCSVPFACRCASCLVRTLFLDTPTVVLCVELAAAVPDWTRKVQAAREIASCSAGLMAQYRAKMGKGDGAPMDLEHNPRPVHSKGKLIAREHAHAGAVSAGEPWGSLCSTYARAVGRVHRHPGGVCSFVKENTSTMPTRCMN